MTFSPIPSCILIFFSLLLSPLSALEIRCNSSLYVSYSDKELQALSYPLDEKEKKAGIEIIDILPPYIECWKLEIQSPQKAATLEGPSLESQLSKARIYINDKGKPDLFFTDERVYPEIISLELSCELPENPELEIWTSWEGTDELKEEIRQYARRHKINVKVLSIPNPESRLLATLKGRGRSPDLIMLSASGLSSLIESESIQPLPESMSFGLHQRGSQSFFQGGKQWALPFYFDTQLLFYNPEKITFPENQPPTFRQLEQMANQLVDKIEVPLTWNVYSSYWLLPFQYSFGKTPIGNTQGNIKINDSATVQAIEYIATLSQKNYFHPMEKDAMLSFFISGKAAIILSASYSIPYFRELNIPFRAVTLPVNDKTGLMASPVLDFKAFAISRKTRNPVLAQKLLRYLTGTGVQIRFCETLYKLPANNMARQLINSVDPLKDSLLKSAETGIPLPSSARYPVYKNIMWKLLRFALNGQMTADEVARQGQKLLDANVW